MKKTILPALMLLFFATSAFAQQPRLDIGLAHQWNFLDRDAALTATRYWGDNGVRVGLHYFQHTAQQAVSWYRPRALNFGQHFGFSLAYERRIHLPDSDLELYPFVGGQAFKVAYVKQDENFVQKAEEPAVNLNTHLGVLVKVKLHRRIFVQASAALGPNWSWGQQWGGKNVEFGGLSGTFALGALYRF
ncbi:MAG: hypothetical protein U0U46_11680 [Saprospiraceae bacterium]|nr:hypothetical protein [Saprospiraceae bacterium]